MACNLKLTEGQIENALTKKIGKDTNRIFTIMAEGVPNGNPTQEFEEWYKETSNKSLSNISATAMADNLIKYFRHRHPNVNDTAKIITNNDAVSTFGYESVFDREEGKYHSANVVLDLFNKVQALDIKIKDDIAAYYLRQLRNNWNDLYIFSEIASLTGKDKKTVEEEWKNADDKLSYIEDGLGGENISSTNSSRLAVYRELNGTEETAKNYMRELLCNPILQDVYNQSRHDEESIFENSQEQISEELATRQKDESGNLDSAEPNVMITQMNNHIGAYSSFMSHVSARIKNYFNSLHKLASTTKKNNKYIEDTNNHYGIAENMNANECSSMLYSNPIIFRNVETMIEGIERIGNQVKGFEAFAKFAEDLRNNPDFATEVFTVFAKTIISKMQVVHSNGTINTKSSNQRSSVHKTFIFNLMNDVRASSLDNSPEYIQTRVNSVETALSEARTKFNKAKDRLIKDANAKRTFNKEAKALLQQAKADTIKLVKFYYPSVENAAITSFIDLNEGTTDLNKINNIFKLLEVVKSTAEASKKTKANYDNLQATIRINEAHNRALDEDKQNKKHWHYDEEYKPVSELYHAEYLDGSQIPSINTICNMLLPYSVVKLQLNSPNVHGNNSSDVINNSHLTNLIKMLDDTYVEYVNVNGQLRKIHRNPSLEKWGLEKAKCKQYKYSSILFEQYDEQGRPINNAIFRRVPKNGGNLCLTEHANSLLKIILFDGSTDMDSGTNIIYPEMTEGDYLPTSYMSYFNPDVDSAEEVNPEDYANYFTRTPSDAPKIFSIRGPRYKTDDLISAKDMSQVQSTAINIVNSIPRPTKEEYAEKYKVDSPLETSTTNLTKYVTEHVPMFVPKSTAYKELEDGTAIVVLFDRNTGDHFIFQGFLENRGRTKQLVDYDLVGCRPGIQQKADGTRVEHDDISTTIKSALISYYTEQLLLGPVSAFGQTYAQATQVVNKKHKMFKLLKNQFKQEMLDMARALHEYFDVDGDGWIHDSQPNASEKIIRIKEGKDNRTGYKFYHLDDNGQVLGHENGHYTLGGNVFHSLKFSLSTEDENGNVVERNYLDDLITTEPNEVDDFGEVVNDGKFHILYGGSDTNSYLHMVIEDNEVADVTFTEEQDVAVDEALSRFILEYNQQAQNKIKQHASSIKGVSTNRLAVTDYAMNHLAMLMEYDTLFEGNFKFYKDAQTALKRAKEHQGSGIPYGITDYNDINTIYDPSDFDDYDILVQDDNIVDVKNSLLNTLRKNGEFNGTILENIRQRNRFIGVTVKNSITTNEKGLNLLKKQLTEILTPSMGAEEAERHAMDILYGPVQLDKNGKPKKNEDGSDKRRGGFTETKVNDAQSYITFDEWVRRVAAKGQLQRYLPLIKRIINERYINVNDPKDIIDRATYLDLSEEAKAAYDIEPLSAQDIKEFIQVQKNFYYDIYYDNRYGLEVPRQIKNAELVLVPRMIKGTQLETVYNLMKAAGVDQLNTVETSKAANEKILTLWDNDGNLAGADTFVTEAKEQGYRQVFDYKNLYTQQETPQHMNSANKAGIQIMKKIIDNIPPMIDGKENPLYAKKEEYFRLVVQNIRDSYSNLMDEINIERDEFGNIQFENGHIKGFNKEGRQVFFNKLREEMLRLGLDDNLIDYVTLDPETGQPLMPAVTNNIISKFESVVQSMFNSSITRQKLPGFHAAQVTNIGWRAMSDTVTNRLYDTDLEYHPMQYARKNNPEDKISRREYDALPDKVKEQYEESGPAPYIEIMLPLSAFGIDRNSDYYKGMTDAQILEELKKEGLDIIMGYRIPTEGKQSVCNMRVVAFTDDSLGSTIVVPNDWVSQTGSDFDIDSVYGIQFATITLKNGRVRRVKYHDTHSLAGYFNYVTSFKDRNLDSDVKGDIRKVVNAAKDIYNNMVGSLNEYEKNAYKELPEQLITTVQQINKQVDAFLQRKNASGAPAYAFRLNYLRGKLETILNKYTNLPEQIVNQVKKFNKTINEIEQVLNGNLDDLIADENSIVSQIVKDQINTIQEKIKGTKIMTYEEYNSSPVESINSGAARNNQLIQTMIDILSDPSSLEENLSRSNFDDIIYWRNKIMNDNDAARRANRSPYNIFDQIAYQEDAMSGATLKGMSVALDTLCSVCNTAQAELSSDKEYGNAINIIYDAKDFEDPQAAMSRFNAGKYKKGNTFRIKHTQYGWSNDNRNVSGKILTAYSSQTTAHILDAIKEGAIPNVNAYSFGVYKTLVNIGSDYKTAISFIMQPGVKRIIDNYNRNNSVFVTSYDNPIHQALKDIAKESGIRVDFSTPITAVINALQSKYGESLNKMFKQSWHSKDLKINFNDKNLENLPLIVPMLYDRIKEQGQFAKDAENADFVRNTFDIAVILSFYKLNKTAKAIGNIARCCNPDKFGAKQTVYATSKVFDDMHDMLYDYTIGRRQKPSVLIASRKNETKKVPLVQAIYPGIENGTRENPAQGIFAGDNIAKSAYPTLYAFLKYASGTSTLIAQELFITQNPNFVSAVKGFVNVLSNRYQSIDEETYTNLQKYILSYEYGKVPSIVKPLTYDKDSDTLDVRYFENVIDRQGNVVTNEDGTPKLKQVDERKERARVYGLGHKPGLKYVELRYGLTKNGKPGLFRDTHTFTVADINNPTQEEIDAYLKLSPAQKVYFIQTMFDNPGVFGQLRVSLTNGNNRGWRAGMQTIEYTENNTNPNVIYSEFNKAFYNSNPLVKLAAFDVIKYGVLVEGLNMSNTSVNKIISNKPLLDPISEEGTGFINSVVDNLINIGDGTTDLSDAKCKENIYENYLRSHPETKGIKLLNIAKNKGNREKYGINVESYGLITVNIDQTDKAEDRGKVEDKWYEKMTKAGFMIWSDEANQHVPNSYIRIKNEKEPFLYKLVPVKDVNTGKVISIIGYPLNPLEKNETTDISAKDANNTHYPERDTFKLLVDEWIASDRQQKLNGSYIKAKQEEMKQAGTWRWQSKNTQYAKDTDTVDFNAMELAETSSGMAMLVDRIQTYFGSGNNSALYLYNNALTNYIKSVGTDYSSLQEITMPNNQRRLFNITKVSTLSLERKYLGKDENNNYILSNDNFNTEVQKIEDPQVQQAIRDARESKIGVELSKYNKQHINNLYVVTPYVTPNVQTNTNSFASEFEEFPMDNVQGMENTDTTLDKLIDNSISFINTEAIKGDELAIEASSDIKFGRIESTTIASNDLTIHSLRNIASHLQKKSQELKTKFDSFIQNPAEPNKYISILDPVVQEQLVGNETLVNEYLHLINQAKAYYDMFAPYKAFDITSNDPEVRYHMNRIKEYFDVISQLPIMQANDNFARGYVTRLTKNPIVKDRLIDVMDGFWQTYGGMWAFHDIMENGNPLLQTVLTDVMGDIEAKKRQHIDDMRNHHKRVDAIIKDAIQNGRPIDWTHVFNDDGTFVYDYTAAFTEAKEKLREERVKAEKKGRGSVEHLKAKLRYDSFKAIYVNQPVVQEYYIQQCTLDKAMLDNHADIFSRYKRLQYEYTEILDSIGELGYTSELTAKLQDVKDRMTTLRYRGRYNADGTINAEESVHIDALEQYMKDTSALNKKYFEYESQFGFEEQLDINLSIVRAAEEPDQYGIPKYNAAELADKEDYQRAKAWLQKNAYYSLEVKRDENGYPISLGAKLEDASNRLIARHINGQYKYITPLYRQLSWERYKNGEDTLYDEYKVYNGSKLTPEERARIKLDQQQRLYGVNMPVGTDLILISNDNGDRSVQYKAEFYRRMQTDGFKNPTYFSTVTAINNILEKYVDHNGKVRLEWIQDTPEGITELKELTRLYKELRKLRKTTDSTNGKAVRKFIEEEVEFVEELDLYREQLDAIRSKGYSNEFLDAFVRVTLSYDEEGNVEFNEDGRQKLNPYLFSYMKPKDEAKWVDQQKTEDLALINQHYYKANTVYYYAEKEAAKRQDDANPGQGIFRKWMKENHIYNPYTRRLEPLECWTERRLKEQYVSGLQNGEWLPLHNQRNKVPKSGKKYRIINGERKETYNANNDFENKNYIPNATIEENYIKGADNGRFDSKINMTPEEQAMRDYLQSTLLGTTSHNLKAKRHFEKGNLPWERKQDELDAKQFGKSLATVFGFNLGKSKEQDIYQSEVGYDKDYIPPMPLTRRLFDEKLGSKKFDKPEPQLKDYQNMENPVEAYEKDLQEWQEEKDRIKAENDEINRQLMNKDWLGVIDRYLDKAAEYNAVQDNKDKLYYLLNMLRRHESYIRDAKGWFSDQLKTSTVNGTTRFDKAVDTNLIKQYENIIRRLLFNQWKERDSKKVNAANRLQNFTSANYMMLNFRGGLANVTLGETGILAESAAAEYFGRKNWGFATKEWTLGVTGFVRSLYEETSVNKQDAICKYFLVVDYDEITGVPRKQTMDKYVERFRNAMFSPQTAGEHFMQNSVLFAMLKSHKIVSLPDDALGIGFTYMNETEYIRYRQASLLNEILTEEQLNKFAEFKRKIASDKNVAKDYAWWRKDALTEFIVHHCNKEQRKQFVKARDQQEEKFKKEFAKKTDLYEQMKLGDDGRLDFVEGSELAALNDDYIQDGKLSKAHALMGRFANRVRLVNNKIHGVYNKMGQAYIEKTWWGSLVMQYHKHLPTGLIKRYRARGFFSETRGTGEKGMLWSVIDWLSLNHRVVKADLGLSDKNIEAIEGVQNIVKYSIAYTQQLISTFHLLPRHERANIKRNLGDLAGTLSGLIVAIGLMAMGVGDDDDDNVVTNYFLYEADRLASESFLYNPIGLWTETKTLMSTPIAAQSVISDVFSGAYNIASWLATGSVEDLTYQSGQFAGRNKLGVYFERRIPIWNGIRGVIDTPHNNHYYKRGKKVISLVPAKDIAQWIRK